MRLVRGIYWWMITCQPHRRRTTTLRQQQWWRRNAVAVFSLSVWHSMDLLAFVLFTWYVSDVCRTLWASHRFKMYASTSLTKPTTTAAATTDTNDQNDDNDRLSEQKGSTKKNDFCKQTIQCERMFINRLFLLFINWMHKTTAKRPIEVQQIAWYFYAENVPEKKQRTHIQNLFIDNS